MESTITNNLISTESTITNNLIPTESTITITSTESTLMPNNLEGGRQMAPRTRKTRVLYRIISDREWQGKLSGLAMIFLATLCLNFTACLVALYNVDGLHCLILFAFFLANLLTSLYVSYKIDKMQVMTSYMYRIFSDREWRMYSRIISDREKEWHGKLFGLAMIFLAMLCLNCIACSVALYNIYGLHCWILFAFFLANLLTSLYVLSKIDKMLVMTRYMSYTETESSLSPSPSPEVSLIDFSDNKEFLLVMMRYISCTEISPSPPSPDFSFSSFSKSGSRRSLTPTPSFEISLIDFSDNKENI